MEEYSSLRKQNEAIEEMILAPYATLSKNTKGRLMPILPCNMRTEFQRDRDRVIHSKSFRRLKHKTQVFLSPEGDHYRTRLTHTLEVAQIGRTIARGLRLNEDLVEAAALAHDLGHTPFGHSGETVLNKICRFGFKHYEQSLRVIDVLENGGMGMNLTFEVRDAVVNHTGSNQASTLEGRIIKFADRIAYINHDIDDALRSGAIAYDAVPKELNDVLGNSHGERISTMIYDIIENSKDGTDIRMSDTVGKAMNDLRQFMFDEVYTTSYAKTGETRAMRMIEILFNFFVKNPDKLPAEYRRMIENEEIDRIVCDYISGMTDNYVVKVFEEYFVPQGFKI